MKYANSAEEIWSDLRERFGKESAARVYELKQLLVTTRQDRHSVSAYNTYLRVLWDKIASVFSVPKCSCAGCTCGVRKKLIELRDNERLCEFRLVLDHVFSAIWTQILAMKPTPTLGEAYYLVGEDEQQRAISIGKKTSIVSCSFQAFVGRNIAEKTGPRYS